MKILLLEEVKSIKIFKKTFIVLCYGVVLNDQVQVYSSSDNCSHLTCESYIEIKGIIRKLPKNNKSFRPFELEVHKITVYGESDNDLKNYYPDTAGISVGTKFFKNLDHKIINILYKLFY